MHLHYFTKKLGSSVIFGFAILKSFISVSVLVVINNFALDMTGKAIFHSSNNEIISLYRAHIAYSVRISVYTGHELLRVLRLGGYWRHQSRDVWRHCDVGEEEISRWYMTPGWSITWRRRTTATAELQGCLCTGWMLGTSRQRSDGKIDSSVGERSQQSTNMNYFCRNV